MQCEHWEQEPIRGQDNYYFFPDGMDAGYLCNDCAVESGFCPYCGYFVLGSDDDRLLMTHGACVGCWEDIRADAGEYDEDDNDDW